MAQSNGSTSMPTMTATSFAVLGLLAMHEWTTYELAQQMERSFSYFWPRAERRIYDEPKRLAAAGYATSRKEVVGRRPRTCWQITDTGREALKSWLAQPPTSPPVIEFEGMVKIFVAENGSKGDLLASLNAIRDNATRQGEVLAAMCREVAENGGPFPDRVHINALAMSYAIGLAEFTERWAQDAGGLATKWNDTNDPGVAARKAALDYFQDHAG
ncbi:PadR family transcriptional regulator [Antricoccus suffuscus]|uniref:PadR family transcriptional regulator n=1 Tax=Antricoccus suffuscus TaxID=1629062 RepID=A0A2T1A080_9ACTN|nr:PadR family transcriptional regulator [Antricoccus suffuscus]PRZ41934.1 PadR family transcriptional regulator [Antricoccus suffuscus]